MRHRGVVFLLIALLLASTTVSVSNEGAPQISDQIEVDAAPIWSEMDITLGPQRYWFTASDSKPYTLIAESYQAQLTVWIATADGKTLQTAELTKEGQFRYRTTIDTEKGARYQIGVAVADDAPAPIGYRLGLYSSTKAELPQDARLHIVNLHTVDTFISSFTLSESQALYLNHPARFFQLHLEDKEGQWIVAKVSAHAFIPRVHLLNPMNQAVIGDDKASYSVRKKQSRAAAKITGNSVSIVIYAGFGHGAIVDQSQPSSFELAPALHERNPYRSLITKISEVISNPVASVIIGIGGIGVGCIFSFMLFSARRPVLYRLESDHLVLDVERALRSRLQVLRNGQAVTGHVGVCTVSVRRGGYKDIRNEDITEPLALSFNQMTDILLVSADASSGWTGISIPSGARTIVQLSLNHLKRGDCMSLTVFYTQDKVQMISIAAIGEIYDGSFREAVRFDSWKRNRFWPFAVLGIIPLTAMAVAFLDLWLNIFSLEIVELAESVMSVASIWFSVLGGLYVVSDPYLLRKITAFSGRPYINKFEAEPEHR